MLVLEVHFDVKRLNIPTFGNKPSFQCKLYKTMFKDKNKLSYNMMDLCLEYIGKESLKMYPTITEFEVKELTRLREKHGKILPNHPLQEIMVFLIGNCSKNKPPYGFFAFMSNLTKVSF